jgi:zinc transport system substrate-binding protein
MALLCRHLPAALILLLSLPAYSGVKVVTSIKPLQLISSAITEGVSEPEVLLSPGASPHNYHLRPSDIRLLSNADLIFWIGPQLESFLKKPLQQLPDQQRIIALMAVINPGVYSNHDGQNKHEEQESHHHEHDSDAEPGHPSQNPHIWLNPDNALRLAETIATALSTRDPDNETAYRDNLKRFEAALTRIDLRIKKRLAPVRQREYFVFHDAYGTFETHYGLTQQGAFTINPQRRPGARHLESIRQRLLQSRAGCVFTEPQFKPAIIEAVTEGLDIRKTELDPMAGNIKVSANGYLLFLDQLAENFHRCLTP